MPPPTGTSLAAPSSVPAGPLRLLALALLDGWLAMPLAGSLAPDGVVGVVPGAWPASFASYGTAAVLHAVSTPATPRTPAPSSTQRLVAH
jgi:hypothetical protein